MKTFTSKTQKIGEVGEDITCNYLVKQGFRIVERNYTRKWGELDIVAFKGQTLHFIEVKSITIKDGFSRENTYRPEENMHFSKIKRLKRAIETYLMEREVKDDIDWKFDLACVYIGKPKQDVEIIEDIILI